VGEFKGKAGVFPVLIDKPDFEKVQAMLERNKGTSKDKVNKDGKTITVYTGGRRGHRAEIVNIFSGMVFCMCGRPSTLTKNDTRYYYRCPVAYMGTGCNQRHVFPSHLLEEDMFAIVLQQTPKALLGNADTTSKERLAVLETNKEALARKIKTLLALDAGLTDEDIKTHFEAFKTERVQVEKDIADLRNTMSLIGHAPKALNEIEALLASGDDLELDALLRRMQDTLKDKAIRQRLQVLMPSILKSIHIDFKGMNFTATFTSGKEVKHSVAT
jgi:hypothetical protein